MPNISELFQSDRISSKKHDETLQALHDMGEGDYLDPILADESPDRFPDDLFEQQPNPADEFRPEELLESGDEPLLLEAYQTAPELGEPAYAEMNATPEPEEMPAFMGSDRLERTHGIADNAGKYHVEESEDEPTDAEALREERLNELTDLVTEVIRFNVLTGNGAVLSDEQQRAYDEADERTIAQFELCTAAGDEPETLAYFAKLLDSTKWPVRPALPRDAAAPVEFTAAHGASTHEIKTQSVAIEAVPIDEAIETDTDEEKYPLGSRVKAFSDGTLSDGWKIMTREADEKGVIRHSAYSSRLDQTAEGLTEGDLDTFQKLDVPEQAPTAREELKEFGNELRRKAAEKVEGTKDGLTELREYAADKMVEAGHRLQEVFDGGVRNRLKKVFTLPEMARRYAEDTIINPYNGLKKKFADLRVTGAVEATVGIIKFAEARAESVENWFARRNEGKLLERGGLSMDDVTTPTYLSEEIAAEANDNEFKKALRFVNRNRVLMAGLALSMVTIASRTHGFGIEGLLDSPDGTATGGGMGAHDLLQGGGHSAAEQYDGTYRPDPDVTTHEIPNPSEGSHASAAPEIHPSHTPAHETAQGTAHAHEAQSHDASDTSGGDTTPSHEAAPHAETIPEDAYVVRSGDGPIDTVERLGGSIADWDKMKHDFYEHFHEAKNNGTLYLSGGDVRYDHQGHLPKEMVEFMAKRIGK